MKKVETTNNQHTASPNFQDDNWLYLRMIDEIQDYAIILLDQDGYVRHWNKGAEKIKQYTEEEIYGKHFSIFYLQEDIDRNLPWQLLMEARDTGRAAHEGWRKRKNGSEFWGSITITAIHDDHNNILGFSKVTRDLTDKKNAENALKMSDERYQQMIAEVQDYAIILLDENGIIRNWNAGAERIKGYSASEIIGKKFNLFYPAEARESNLPEQLLRQARETGKAVQEGWRVRKDGSRFWGTIVITALHGKNNEIIGFTKVTRDLTEKKIAEEKLLTYMSELEIQNRELEQFAYVASHDLQEPLRKIQTFTELIQKNFSNEEFAKKYLEKLDQSAKRMVQLIKSLLNYSRLTKDKTAATQIDLNEILNEVKQDFELLIEEKKATIISDPLPSITGIRVQFGQLFSNLISNSLKFSKGDTQIRITASRIGKDDIPDVPDTRNDEYMCIDFEDNGIGFEQQYDKIIFSLFQRLHGKHDYAGTGIGLALCKKIVENHGGFIKATGELNKGAKFSIFIPLAL